MKKFITFMLMTAFVCLVSFNASAQKKNVKNIQEVTFVSDIDCPNCVKKLQATLPYEKGVKDLKITLQTKTIWFKYDANKTDKQKLAKAITDNGFTAQEVAQKQEPNPSKK